MNERLISIFSWIFGALLIFAGLRVFTTSIFGGFIAIFAGILLLPIFQNKIDLIFNRKIKKRWFVILTMILMAFSGRLISSAEEQALKDGTASQELKDQEAYRLKLQAEREELEGKRAEEKRLKELQAQSRNNQISIQTDSKIALKNFLKDPDSAEIRNHNGNCGEVNSKNSFGGYSGFRRFIASPAIVAIEGENMSADEFQKAWEQLCK